MDNETDRFKTLMVDAWGISEETIESIKAANGLSYEDIYSQLYSAGQETGSRVQDLDLSEIFIGIATGGRHLKRADSFEVRPHEYLWQPYVPMNDVTILMAPGGTGKTMFCCWLLAQISNGGYICGDTDYYSQYESKQTGELPEPKRGLYISSEDDGSELRARLEASKANLAMIDILDKIDSEGMSFTDDGYDEFLQTVKDSKASLVIIDPWQAFIGRDIDVSKVNHVRPAMQRLAVIANECHCSIILISHVNKKPQGENINNAAIGSADFVNAARSALTLVFSDDEEEENTRILVHSKANYSAAGESLKFDITPLGAFDYRGRSDVTRQMLEEAARNHKTVAEIIAKHREDKETAGLLIDAVCSYAKAGESVIISYEQFTDDFGEEVFGATSRPSGALKKIETKLKRRGITLEYKTLNGHAKRVMYNGKNSNGVEIYKERSK